MKIWFMPGKGFLKKPLEINGRAAEKAMKIWFMPCKGFLKKPIETNGRLPKKR